MGAEEILAIIPSGSCSTVFLDGKKLARSVLARMASKGPVAEKGHFGKDGVDAGPTLSLHLRDERRMNPR